MIPNILNEYNPTGYIQSYPAWGFKINQKYKYNIQMIMNEYEGANSAVSRIIDENNDHPKEQEKEES